MGEFVGKRVVPDHVGVWEQNKTYEPLMIVLDSVTGDSYISRRAVPAGISLADESYWSLCAHYSAQMRKLEQDVDADVQKMHAHPERVQPVGQSYAVFRARIGGEFLFKKLYFPAQNIPAAAENLQRFLLVFGGVEIVHAFQIIGNDLHGSFPFFVAASERPKRLLRCRKNDTFFSGMRQAVRLFALLPGWCYNNPNPNQ